MVKALAICTTKPYIQIYKVSQSSWDICDTVRRDTVYLIVLVAVLLQPEIHLMAIKASSVARPGRILPILLPASPGETVRLAQQRLSSRLSDIVQSRTDHPEKFGEEGLVR
jgi:hypothetical protein